MSRLLARSLIGALALVLAAVVPAGAEPRFDSGAGLPTVGDFVAITLDGTSQLTTAEIAPFVVIDDTNSNAGWNVTLEVPTLQNGTGADCSTGATSSIPTSTLSMNPPVVTPADQSTSIDGGAGYGYIDFTRPQKIVIADAGHGAGQYVVSPQIMKLPLASNLRAGSYCTQATIAITSGP